MSAEGWKTVFQFLAALLVGGLIWLALGLAGIDLSGYVP